MKDDSLFEVTPAVLGVSLLVAVAISFVSWCWLLLHRFAVPEPQWLALVTWLRFAWEPELRWLTLQSLVQGIAPVGFVLYLAGDWGPSDKARVLRGARLVDVKALAARTRLKKHKDAPSQVELAGVQAVVHGNVLAVWRGPPRFRRQGILHLWRR